MVNAEGLTGLGPHSYRDAHCESGFRSTRILKISCQSPHSVCDAYVADKREHIPIAGPHFSTVPCRYGPSSALPSMPSGNSGTCDPSCIIQECGQLSRDPHRPHLPSLLAERPQRDCRYQSHRHEHNAKLLLSRCPGLSNALATSNKTALDDVLPGGASGMTAPHHPSGCITLRPSDIIRIKGYLR